MMLTTLARRSLRRNRLRGALTILGIAFAVLAFVTIRTVVWAWTVQVEDTANDRIVTRHKVTFVMQLPKRYVEEVRNLKDERGRDMVRCATYQNWFGGKDPNHEDEFFATIACEASKLFEVYDDMRAPKEQVQAFIEDRQGAVVGEALMKRFGWKLGQTITLKSQIYPGDWELHIVAVYEALRKSIDPAQVFFHWELLNERLPERRRDEVGWIVARVTKGSSAVDTSVAIDRMFDASDVQTLSQDERAFNQSFLAMFSAILAALDVLSVVVLGILMLILGNTVAMGVRERTSEYAVLRAIGFLPRHLAALVVGEATVLGLLGGVTGVALAALVVNMGIGRYVEENLGQFFPFFRMTPESAVMAVAIAVALGVIASAPPAIRAYRLHVVEALRRLA